VPKGGMEIIMKKIRGALLVTVLLINLLIPMNFSSVAAEGEVTIAPVSVYVDNENITFEYPSYKKGCPDFTDGI
jgi:hypothetical protein